MSYGNIFPFGFLFITRGILGVHSSRKVIVATLPFNVELSTMVFIGSLCISALTVILFS